MINVILQTSVIIGALLFIVLIVLLLKKGAFSLKYSLLWMLTALLMLIIGIFPQVLVGVAYLLGFELASNALFTFLIGFIILILLQQTSVISQQNEKIKTLTQSIALLEKRVRELEACKEEHVQRGEDEK